MNITHRKDRFVGTTPPRERITTATTNGPTAREVISMLDNSHPHRIQATPHFWLEMVGSETGAWEDGVEVAGELIQDVEQRDSRRIVWLCDRAYDYLIENLPYHIDRWGDWGLEGSPFIRVGERILHEAQ
jgi:hypothetical protein